MHEVDMTRCLLLSLNEWKGQHRPQEPEVRVVHLQVGTFTCVEPEALVFTYGTGVRGSWLEGSELRIESIPLRARCLRCEAIYDPDQGNAYRSPCCDHPMEEIVSGRELRIRSIDYQLHDATSPEAPQAAALIAVPTPALSSAP
ncbi:hydrogenase maturation nickel metallochaperone HypA [Synechococcus sp. Tobar12-5m-g]|uniref:hydrogenase maturation nickel metallochaperone HypA/HybF n=1 Tax=unclassified Synechococcus TaxID=2626047 RepID=UPI0020CE028D|nr:MULTISPECIES: hydrogenase maturation nickel metallochaperone HypA [unclassified Synechococcus]MCP9771183.1 hydrogenase maturation nickel metallochaperone HypA [Synechococcus sp. Tobar12-5m-g]MCP9872123.1 hydrogenase maturation nickel metallochaperone HypA [Synechococcus sp. Cruz CV-v-12]